MPELQKCPDCGENSFLLISHTNTYECLNRDCIRFVQEPTGGLQPPKDARRRVEPQLLGRPNLARRNPARHNNAKWVAGIAVAVAASTGLVYLLLQAGGPRPSPVAAGVPSVTGATELSQKTASPTPTSTPKPVATLIVTPTRVSLALPTMPKVMLETQLPRDVFEAFEGSFYGTCSEPPFEQLRVAQVWSGNSSSKLTFIPLAGTYFLVVVGNPQGQTWQFDSVLTSTSRKSQSLHIDSTVPDDLADSQEWCTRGVGVPTTNFLDIEATNLAWSVYLVIPSAGNPLSEAVKNALSGYYSVCPPYPPLESLQAAILGAGASAASLNFSGQAPHYFLGVQFQPISDVWYFRSVNVSGNWRTAGPSVSSKSRERIDFTATCPTTADLGHLEIEAEGGQWTVYLITVSQK